MLARLAVAAALVVLVPFLANGSSRAGPRVSGPQARNPSYCPARSHALDGVYHPSRLTILKLCQRASGLIEHVVLETDGDLHIRLRLDPTYAALTNPVNDAKQRGDLVVEFMPRDGGHLPKPAIGARVTLVGAWVTDGEHSWNELHPVWREILNGGVYTSGPQNGGSPASDRSKNAAADCRDHAQPCAGYGR